MQICPAGPGDQAAIVTLFRSVFTDAEGDAEGQVIGGLARDLLTTTASNDRYCFVARDGAAIVGSIILSRIRFASALDAFILAPVAVATARQRRGIGQQLIAFGIGQLALAGVALVITYGDPAFYLKSGFEPVLPSVVPPPHPLQQPQGWLARSLTGNPIRPIQGKSTCVAALDHPRYWA